MTFRIASWVAAAALALTAASPASAETVVNDYFLFLDFGDGLTQTGSLFDVFATAGTSFVDSFYFNSPPPQSDVSFSFLSEFASGPEIAFSGFSLTPFQPGETPLPVPLASLSGAFFGSGSTLSPIDSGVYVLQITGTTLTDGASFDGELVASVAVPVPEPAEWALTAMGLGVLGATLRRKARPAA